MRILVDTGLALSMLVSALSACGQGGDDNAHDAAAQDGMASVDAASADADDAGSPDGRVFDASGGIDAIGSIDSAVSIDGAGGGDVDWSAIAADCETIEDVAWVSDSEVFLACGSNGVARVTPAGVTWWQPSSYDVKHVDADGPDDVRILACYEVYRFDDMTGWTHEGDVADYTYQCGTALGGGEGGWFAGGRRFGGYGQLWRLESEVWTETAALQLGWFHFAIVGFDELYAGTWGADDGLRHFTKQGSYWITESNPGYSVRAMWRVPSTGEIYFANTPGNGPQGINAPWPGAGGIYHGPNGDAWVWEWSPPEAEGGGWPRVDGIWGRSATEVYSVGQVGVLALSTGDGNWTLLDAGTDDDLEFVWSWQGQLIVASADMIYEVP